MKKVLITVVAVALLASVLALCLTACDPKGKAGYTPVPYQADTLTELNAGTADVAILDYTMASYLLAQETSLTKNLTMIESIEFPSEEYGVAFRKGSTGLADKVNRALNALKDTKVKEIAARYGLEGAVLSLDYTAPASVNDNDWNAIVAEGKIVIGYTLNPPMAIQATAGDPLTGFDIELPKAVFEWINKEYGTNLTVEFQLIDWNTKETELSSGNIDVIWNGMTITEEREAAMTISNPYLLNRQVAVIRSADADKYTTFESLKKARVVAENGSAGEEIANSIFA